jgi:hypothetical protein
MARVDIKVLGPVLRGTSTCHSPEWTVTFQVLCLNETVCRTLAREMSSRREGKIPRKHMGLERLEVEAGWWKIYV